ncbi:MAG: hypothetical protein WCW84_01990 [Sulfurimonas sp.]|jgi:hypothetical protein
MQVAFQLHSADLDGSFIESIKNLFKNKNIEIVVHDDEDEEKRFGDILEHTYADSKPVSEEMLFEALRES